MSKYHYLYEKNEVFSSWFLRIYHVIKSRLSDIQTTENDIYIYNITNFALYIGDYTFLINNIMITDEMNLGVSFRGTDLIIVFNLYEKNTKVSFSDSEYITILKRNGFHTS